MTTVRSALFVAAFASSVASAQMLQDQGPPLHRIVHKNTFALRYNPLGLLYDGRFSYRLRLYESEGKALRDNFIGVGLAPTISPAFLRVGPFIEFNPASMFGLWGAIQFVQYFGSFDLAQGFPGAQSDFSDTAIRANGKGTAAMPGLGLNFPANGYEVTLGANFQAKVWNIIIRSQARLIYGSLNLPAGQRVYYDQFYDMLMPNQGWAFVNDLDVLYQTLENKLIAGARYTATAPLYDPTRHYDPDYPGVAVDNSMHRVGPFVGYTFKIEDGAAFNNPTVFILVQWWLKHRFRTGADTSQALPLMGVGFQMTGDFLTIK